MRHSDKLTDFAWKELGKTNSRYNNLTLSFGYKTRYDNPTYVGNRLRVPLAPWHFVTGGSASNILYNPGWTTGTAIPREVYLYVK